MADTLASITGMPPEEAAGFLEMAGGNVETAVAMYFDMQGGGGFGGGGGGSGTLAGGGTGPSPADSPAHVLLFGSGGVPPSWLDQGFEFDTDAASAIGIIQHKNGPCGALAAVNAEVIAHLDCPMPSTVVSDAALCAALGKILWRCAAGGTGVVVAKWEADVVGGAIATEALGGVSSSAEVAAKLLPTVNALRGRGGCVLFCYAAILTRGVDTVRSEACSDGGGVPLVSGPFALCGTELISLLLAGIARGNIGAYDATSGAKIGWRTVGDVGLISADEIESGARLR